MVGQPEGWRPAGEAHSQKAYVNVGWQWHDKDRLRYGRKSMKKKGYT